jgi:hypothetical protein
MVWTSGHDLLSLYTSGSWKKISNEIALLALQTARISSIIACSAATANTTHLHDKKLGYQGQTHCTGVLCSSL